MHAGEARCLARALEHATSLSGCQGMMCALHAKPGNSYPDVVPCGPGLLLPLPEEHARGGAAANRVVSFALLAALAPYRKPDAPDLAPGDAFQLRWSAVGEPVVWHPRWQGVWCCLFRPHPADPWARLSGCPGMRSPNSSACVPAS